MSRCRRTDALLASTFAGDGPTAAQAAHVSHCAECSRAFAATRRFDGELRSVVDQLVTEPVPATFASTPMEIGWSRMNSTGRTIVYALASVATVAMILGGGWWLAQTSDGRLDVGSWMSGLLADGEEHNGRREQAEEEARAAAAEAARRQAEEVARQQALARRQADEHAEHAEILEAAIRGAGVPDDVTPLGIARPTSDVAVSVVIRDGGLLGDEPQRWIGLVRRNGDGWVADPSEWIGVNIPRNDGLTAYPLDILEAELDGWIIVGEAPAPATSVELFIGGRAHGYSLPNDGGIVLVAPDEFEGSADFRVLGSGGDVILEGSMR